MTSWNIDRFDILSKPLEGVSDGQDLSVRKQQEVDSQEVNKLAERFEELMDDPRDNAEGDGGSKEATNGGLDEPEKAADLFRAGHQTQDPETRAPQIPLSELFDAQAMALNPAVEPGTDTTAAERSRVDVAMLLDKVADQIFIRVPEANEQEVIIRFGDDVLPETEVRIKLADGQLSVDFTTSAQPTYQLLNAEVDELQARLLSLIANPDCAVKISVRTLDASETRADADGDSPAQDRQHDASELNRDER